MAASADSSAPGLNEEEYTVERATEPPASPDMEGPELPTPPTAGPAVMSDFVENLIDSAIGTRDSDQGADKNDESGAEADGEETEREVEEETRGTQTDEDAQLGDPITSNYDEDKDGEEEGQDKVAEELQDKDGEEEEQGKDGEEEEQDKDGGEEQEKDGEEEEQETLEENGEGEAEEEKQDENEETAPTTVNATEDEDTENKDVDNEKEGNESDKDANNESDNNVSGNEVNKESEKEVNHESDKETHNESNKEANNESHTAGENGAENLKEDGEPKNQDQNEGEGDKDTDAGTKSQPENGIGEENEGSTTEEEKKGEEEGEVKRKLRGRSAGNDKKKSTKEKGADGSEEKDADVYEVVRVSDDEGGDTGGEKDTGGENGDAAGEDEAPRKEPRVLGSIRDVNPSDVSSPQATRWIVNSKGELVPMSDGDSSQQEKSGEPYPLNMNDMTPWTIDPDNPAARREVSFTEVMQMWKGGPCPIFGCTSSGIYLEERMRATHFERYHMECQLTYVCPFPVCPGRDEHFRSPDMQNLIKHMQGSSHGASDRDVEKMTTNLIPRKILNPGFIPPVMDPQYDNSQNASDIHDTIQYEDLPMNDQTTEDITDLLHIPPEAVDMWRASNKCPVSNCKSPAMTLKHFFDWHWYVFHEPRIKVYYCPVEGCRRANENWSSRRRRDLISHLKQRHKLETMPDAVATQIVKNPNYKAPDELAVTVEDEAAEKPKGRGRRSKAKTAKADKNDISPEVSIPIMSENSGGVLEMVDDSVPAEFENAWDVKKRCPCRGCPMTKISFRPDFQRHWKEHHVKLSSFYVCPDSGCQVAIGGKVMHYRSREWRQVVHHLMGPTHGLTRTEAEQVGAALVPNHLDNPMYIAPVLQSDLTNIKDSSSTSRGRTRGSARNSSPATVEEGPASVEPKEENEDDMNEHPEGQIPESVLEEFEKNTSAHIPKEFLDFFKTGKGCPAHGCTANSCRFHISELSRHWKSKHMKIVPQYWCPIKGCTVSAKRKVSLKQHLEKAHAKRPRAAQDLLKRAGALYVENPDYEKAVLPPDTAKVNSKTRESLSRKRSPPRESPPREDSQPSPPKRRSGAQSNPPERVKSPRGQAPSKTKTVPELPPKDTVCTSSDLKFFERDVREHVPKEFNEFFQNGGGCVSADCASRNSKMNTCEFVRHWKGVHMELVPMLKCHLDDCTHTYKNQKGLKAHLEREHGLKQRAAISLSRAARAVFGKNPNYRPPVLPNEDSSSATKTAQQSGRSRSRGRIQEIQQVDSDSTGSEAGVIVIEPQEKPSRSERMLRRGTEPPPDPDARASRSSGSTKKVFLELPTKYRGRKSASSTPNTPGSRADRGLKRRNTDSEDQPPSKIARQERDPSFQPHLSLLPIPDKVCNVDAVRVISSGDQDVLRSGREKWIVPKRSLPPALPAPVTSTPRVPAATPGRRGRATRSSGIEPASEFAPKGVDVTFETVDDDDGDSNFGVEIPMPSLDDIGLGFSTLAPGTSSTQGKSPSRSSPRKAQDELLGYIAELTKKQEHLEKQLLSQGGKPYSNSEHLKQITALQSQNEALRFQNQALREQLTSGGMAKAWKEEKESLLQQVREKDATIRTLQDVVTRFMSQPQTPNVMNQMFNLPGAGGKGSPAESLIPTAPSPRMMIKPRAGQGKAGSNQRCSVTLRSGASIDFEYDSFPDFMQKIGSLNDQHGLSEN